MKSNFERVKMKTIFQFSYITNDNELYKLSASIYAESLYFAVKKFKDSYNAGCKIIAIKGYIETEMGTFEIIGINL